MGGRLLVAYSNSSNHVSTTAEYLESISRYSSWDVRYVHVTNGAKLEFDLNEFDAVFNSYCARFPFEGYVSEDYITQLRTFRGVKMLSVQDEYDKTNKLTEAIQNIGFHIVFTCVPAHMTERVFASSKFPQTEFITVLTGYVPDHLVEKRPKILPLAERPIHIGYRARELSARYGRLGFFKVEIGRRMREICEARGIPHDIEWRDGKRLYGEAWFDFIGSCRTNLGSEASSNVFDFDGSIEATYNRLAEARGGPVPYEEFRAYTDPLDNEFDYGQISPRVFEAAVMRTPLILFSGRYLGLISPEEHYIELKPDFSNVDAVLARLDDLDGLAAMADRTYRHLIASGEYSYRRFVGLIEAALERKATEMEKTLRPPLQRWQATESEMGSDPVGLASLDEEPTVRPRHVVFFQCKQAEREAARLGEAYARLSDVYSDEIARLNTVYSAEIAQLSAEITRLNTEIGRLQSALAETWLWRRIKRGVRMSFALLIGRLRRTPIGES
jgi:hypothetical protein